LSSVSRRRIEERIYEECSPRRRDERHGTRAEARASPCSVLGKAMDLPVHLEIR
jgi:hypothetical protein